MNESSPFALNSGRRAKAELQSSQRTDMNKMCEKFWTLPSTIGPYPTVMESPMSSTLGRSFLLAWLIAI